MNDKLLTYLYEDKEVFLSGRVASPQGDVIQSPTMVEILPVGSEINDYTFSKWVKISELLIIRNLDDEL